MLGVGQGEQAAAGQARPRVLPGAEAGAASTARRKGQGPLHAGPGLCPTGAGRANVSGSDGPRIAYRRTTARRALRVRPPARAALRARGRGPPPPSASRAPFPSPAASTPAAIAVGSGRCASTPASAPRPSPTGATATCWSSGTTGLSVAFDLPTQIGYDSDDPHAMGEVGRVGVAIDSLEDMEVLLDGIPLDRVSTSMTINATAAILLALYVAVARRRGIPESSLSGTVQNDILKEYVARGTYIYPPRPVAAAGDRRVRVLRRAGAEVEHHLHLGLPHARGGRDGAAGDRLHVRARARVRARGAKRPGSTSTASASGSPSSSPATRTSSRRSRSSAPRGGCGPASRRRRWARATPRRSSCGSTCRRAASR